MFKNLFGLSKDDTSSKAAAKEAPSAIASRLGLEAEGSYAAFRGCLESLDRFYKPFLHQDYRALLLDIAKEPDEARREARSKEYEYTIMHLNLQRARSRALLFSRDYASIFMPRKSTQELRGEEFRKRAKAVFPNRLIALHENILKDGDNLLRPNSVKDILLRDIPFACPEYLELLLLLLHHERSLELEEWFDLSLPLFGLREGCPHDFFHLLQQRLLEASNLPLNEFVKNWALLVRSRPRPEMHPHMEPYLQWGTFCQDILRHRTKAAKLEPEAGARPTTPEEPQHVELDAEDSDIPLPTPERQVFGF
jgi:hypothetical protein